jgi:hypothetical protein
MTGEYLYKGKKESRTGHKGSQWCLPMPIKAILQFLLLGGAVAMQTQNVQGQSADVAKPGEWEPLMISMYTTTHHVLSCTGGTLVPRLTISYPDNRSIYGTQYSITAPPHARHHAHVSYRHICHLGWSYALHKWGWVMQWTITNPMAASSGFLSIMAFLGQACFQMQAINVDTWLPGRK